MSDRIHRTVRVAALLLTAFLVGGASTEVVVRTHAAVEHEREQRERGAAGELIALRLTTPEGEVVAQPRFIAPTGKAARLILRASDNPDEILTFRVEVHRQKGGLISLRYDLDLPDRAVRSQGSVRLSPGVRQAVRLPQGELVATWLVLPVPSTQFEDYLKAEQAFNSSDCADRRGPSGRSPPWAAPLRAARSSCARWPCRQG